MNILVFSWRDIKHPKAGGAEQVMHEHAKGWVKAGHKVVHFSSKMPELPKQEIIDGVEFKRAGYQYLGVVVAGFFYYLKNRKFDVVIDEFHGVPFFTPLYVRKPRIAVIQEIARNVWFLNPLPWPLNWIIGLIGFLGEPFVFLFYRSTHFITGSESAKKEVIGFGIPEKNITVLPHGVIIDKSKIKNKQSLVLRTKKSKIKTIVYLGVLSKDKGIEDTIKCFSILGKTHPNWNFWVIGKPETVQFGEKIKRLVIDLKLEKKIKFWGFVSQEKKFELLARSHILINLSIHEGWGLVNIEANSVGIPVVSYNSAGLVDSVKHGVSGIICQQNSPEKIAEIVKNLLEEKTNYHKLSKGAISWSKNFTWKKSRKLSLRLINNLK